MCRLRVPTHNADEFLVPNDAHYSLRPFPRRPQTHANGGIKSRERPRNGRAADYLRRPCGPPVPTKRNYPCQHRSAGPTAGVRSRCSLDGAESLPSNIENRYNCVSSGGIWVKSAATIDTNGFAAVAHGSSPLVGIIANPVSARD